MFSEPIRVVAPTALPLSLAELRAQCRLTDDDGTDDDPMLLLWLRAAVDYAERYAGIGLITQTWEQRFPIFVNTGLKLWRRPVQSIVSIEYLDAGGATQLLDTSVYRLSGMNAGLPQPTVQPAYVQAWPDTSWLADEAVVVRYVVGFGDDHNSVPEPIRQALLLMVSYYWNQRETALVDPQIVEVPFGTHALLDLWRPVALA
jgi:uncharacterized phiE125 gp8 family phage protein